MRFSSLIFANLRCRPFRSLLTLGGVAMAVGAVVSLVGISQGFENSLRAIYESRGIDLIVMQAGKAQVMSSVLSAELWPKIEQIEGVKASSPALWENLNFEKESQFNVPTQGWPDGSFLWDEVKVIEGRLPHPDDSRSLVIGKRLSENLRKKTGDDLEIIDGETFRIVGVFDSLNLFESGAILMKLPELQTAMNRGNEVTSYTVVSQKTDRASIEAIQEKIRSLQKGLEVKATDDFVESAVEIKMAQASAWLTSTVALIIGVFGMLNTMLMAVFERTKEIAMLRAIGWRKGTVIRLILGEAILLSIGGAIVGAAGGQFLTWILTHLPATNRMVSASFDPQLWLQAFLIALFMGIVGGAYPAWRAARLLPVEGLRHD